MVIFMKYSLSTASRPLHDFIKEADPHRKVFRIVAEQDISIFNVKKGDVGGWIEFEHNLEHSGNCWIAGDAVVYGSAVIKDETFIDGIVQIGDACEVSGYSKLTGNISLRGKHQIHNVLATMKKWNTAEKSEGIWKPHHQNQLILKGELDVLTSSVQWTAPGTVEDSLILKGNQVMVSGVIEMNGQVVIDNSHVGNTFLYGAISIDESYVVGQDGHHHLFDGTVIIRDSSLHGVMYAKGHQFMLDRVINNGITSLSTKVDTPLELYDVQFWDVIRIAQDNLERKQLEGIKFTGDLELTVTEILETDLS